MTEHKSILSSKEVQELQTEIEVNVRTVNNCCNILKQNTEKLRKLKEMNHRTPYKPQVEYYDEQMVIVNGVSYTRKEPTPIVIQEDENTIVVGGVKYQKVEEQKPQTLYKTLLQQTEISPKVCGEICDIVRGWLIDHTVIETEDAERVTFTILKEQLQTPK